MLRSTFQALLAFILMGGTAWAATDPFVGEWRLDPTRSKLTDEMRVTSVGQNKYAFELGGGEPETITIDGTDQPGLAGSTLAVAAEGAAWKVVRKSGSRTLITARWTLSKDGNSLTDDFTSFGEDGTSTNVKYVYKRTKGHGTGFAGTWVSTSESLNSAFTIRISPYENNGLSFTGPSGTRSVTFDGNAAKRLNTTGLEITERINGKIVLTRQYRLSPDGNTLTLTTHAAGRAFPNLFVFERQ